MCHKAYNQNFKMKKHLILIFASPFSVAANTQNQRVRTICINYNSEKG